MFSAAVILVVIALGLKNPQLILDSDILCVFALCGAVALFWILRYWKHWLDIFKKDLVLFEGEVFSEGAVPGSNAESPWENWRLTEKGTDAPRETIRFDNTGTGFEPEVVSWCVEHGIAVTPGCVTPTEIMAAMKLGLRVVKFFPANVYGGLTAMKSLSGPFGGIRFIPTGGVNAQNLGEFIAAPYVHAVGGSWVCPKADIAAGNFDKITELCAQAKEALLGFEVAHIGINCESADASMAVCEALNRAFSLPIKAGNSSNFASTGIEVMKSMYLGRNGHIAIRTNALPAAVAELEKRGFVCDPSTAKYKGERMTAIYLKEEFGGFAVHLLQK